MREELKKLAADYANLPSLLSLALAVCAGCFFQARYVAATVGNLTAARVIAILCCVALAVMVKGLMRQVKQNVALDAAIEKYAKPLIGILLVIFAVIIDAMTSNASIDAAHISNVAEKVTASVDRAAILDLKQQRERDQVTLANLDSTAKTLGAFAFAKRRLALENAIAEKGVQIAAAEKANAETVAKATDLLIGTVGSDAGINNALWGFYLMVLIFGLEMFAPVKAQSGATAMVTTVEKKESVEISHRQTFTEHTQRVQIKNSEPSKPQDWKTACRMVVAGQLDWPERQVHREYPGVTLYKVQKEFKALRSPSPKDDGGKDGDLPD